MSVSPPTADAVRAALARVIDPEIRRPITELDMVADARVDGSTAHVGIMLTIVGCPAADRIERDVRDAVLAVPGVDEIDLEIGVMSPAERTALVERLRGVKTMPFGPGTLTRVIAVSSGKGGVGKSTITAELAVALASRGLAVGLVDADVFGFSIPGILGIPDAKPTQVGDMILPPVAHGVKVISIGMFVEDGTPVSWRGPLLHRTMQQFLTDVYFGDLDVLLLDLPPGTGDVAITLGQLLPNAEVIVVTTPQAAAAGVAERSGLVARQTGQTVIGVVENMSGGIFGFGGGDEVARRLDVPVLARIPLSPEVPGAGDTGAPVSLASPGDPAAAELARLAEAIVARGRGLAGRSLL
ncbi:P-loop NTPase [Salinibacterium sp. ZJ77]|uniref:P-loop NTPase n=1 Tax=Salinibacterium sp. ZJ77 TaxID=2708337 RepID=UPI001FBA1EA0|nr:P-loop NTPase [Salinibacterium sp. ZJ77]